MVVVPPDAARIHHDCGPINARFTLPPASSSGGASMFKIMGVVVVVAFASVNAFSASAIACSLSNCVSKHNVELRRPLRLLVESDPPQDDNTSATAPTAKKLRTSPER